MSGQGGSSPQRRAIRAPDQAFTNETHPFVDWSIDRGAAGRCGAALHLSDGRYLSCRGMTRPGVAHPPYSCQSLVSGAGRAANLFDPLATPEALLTRARLVGRLSGGEGLTDGSVGSSSVRSDASPMSRNAQRRPGAGAAGVAGADVGVR